MPQTNSRYSSEQVLSTLVLLTLTAIGFYLRFRYLGEIGLDRYADEDIMAVAALGILEHGYPLFPTEMLYFRAFPHTYLMAGSISLFGYNEFALRISSVLFGTALIPLAYLIVRQFMGRQAALMAALLVCFSSWQIEISRTARMYAPFAFFFALSIYFFTQESIQKNQRFPWKAFITALVSISFHALGLSLAVLFLLHLIEPPRWRPKWSHLIAVAVILTAALGADKATQYGFNQANYQATANTEITLEQSPVIQEPPTILEQPVAATEDDEFISSADTFLGILFAPPMDLFKQVYGTSGYIIDLLVVALLLILIIAKIRWRSQVAWDDFFLWLALFGCALFHQFYLAIVVALLLVAFKYCHSNATRLGSIFTPPVLLFSACFILIGLFWFVALLGHTDGSITFKLNVLFDQMFNFPRKVTWKRLFDGRFFFIPLTFLAILLVLLGNKTKQSAKLTAEEVVLWSLIGGEVTIGLIANEFRPRYLFHLDLLLYILITSLVFYAVERFSRPAIPAGTSKLACGLLILLLALPFFNPLRSMTITAATPEDMSKISKKYHLAHWTDRKTTAKYVAEHRRPEDLIAGLDWINLYAYLGRLDYWIRAEVFDEYKLGPASDLRELYVGAKILSNATAIEATLNHLCGSRLWMVVPSKYYRRGNKTNPSLEAFFQNNANHIVYKGHDGESAVFLFDRTQVNCSR